jgi:integrase
VWGIRRGGLNRALFSLPTSFPTLWEKNKMPKSFQRIKTKYQGVYYIEGKAVATGKPERIFYIRYRKAGKAVEEKVGRQFQDGMTPARASRIRALKIEGKRPSRKEIREKKKEKQWTLNALWDAYKEAHPHNKALRAEDCKFQKNIENTIGKKKPQELSPMDIDRLRLKLQKEGKHTTAARVLELLRRTINFGVNRTLIKPLSFKIKIPTLNNQVTEDLSTEQMQNLIRALDQDEDQLCANLFRLILCTGMRRSEVLRLKWDDIDYDRGFIHIRDPKGGTDQIIPLNDAARAVFDAIPQISKNGFIFPGKKENTHLTDMKQSIARIKKEAGLPRDFRPLHGLRHVYASMLASSGKVDMYTLQKLLTHKSPLMTQRYAHLHDEALKRASSVASNIFSRAAEIQREKTKYGL